MILLFSYLKYLQPIVWFKAAKSAIRDINNYFFYHKKLLEIKNNERALEERGIKMDPSGKFYFFVNLPPELLLLPHQEMVDSERTFLVNALKSHNNFFLSHSILELVETYTERIKNDKYYAYYIEISFNWKDSNLKSVIYTLSYPTIIITAITSLIKAII